MISFVLHSSFTMNFIGCSAFILIQVLTGVAAQSSPDEPWCPFGWSAYGDYCYFLQFLITGATWQSAEDSCNLVDRTRPVHLASIHSEQEMRFIALMLQDGDFTWFGLLKGIGNNYAYSDSTSVDFFYWGNDEPNLDNSCVGYDPLESYAWYDKDCTAPGNYICKMKKLPPVPCPDGGIDWGDSCYSFYPFSHTKQEAEERCADEKKNLVSIESAEENAYVSENIRDLGDEANIEAWLGLDRNPDTGEWDWSDPGANYDNYNAWSPGLPVNGSDCAVINSETELWTYPDDCSNDQSRVVCKGARGGGTTVAAGAFIIVAALLLLKVFQM